MTARPKPAKPTAAEKRAGREHMAKVAAMPCVICFEYDMTQVSRTQVHHCIHGRYGTGRAPDSMVLPLCEGHHQGDFDKSKIALHRQPRLWRRQYGRDASWLSWVENKLEEQG